MSCGVRWRISAVLLIAVAAIPACRRAKAPPTPVAPVVAVASAEPLSVPQTAVYLPPWQPVPPEAIPPEPEVEPAPVPAPAVAPPPEQPVTPPPRPRPAGAAGAPPAQPSTPPATVRPAPGGGQLRPLLSREQEEDLQRRLDRSLAAAEKALAQVAAAPRRRTDVERVRAFIDQAQQARRQGDLVRATSLAERAEVLASGLASNRR